VSRIFITGSVDGLGRAAAAALMDKGHDVVLHARSRQRAAPARGDVEEVSRSLLRLVTIVGRYLQDMATTPSQVPGNMPVSTGPWDRACGQAREALTNSAGDLIGPGTSGAGGPPRRRPARWPGAGTRWPPS
jgi:NAD(P)-dependent dehydrogenase (short-subunit alcohol dehydrogenase family)